MTDQCVVQGERRVVTILSCDVTDPTTMAEQLDPEEWAETVHVHGGTITSHKLAGNLGLFGAPEAYEDGSQRAILSKLGIL